MGLFGFQVVLRRIGVHSKHAVHKERLVFLWQFNLAELSVKICKELLLVLRSDSMYRALIYYNLVEGTGEASPIAISTVPVLTFGLPSDTVKIVTDPVTFESAWLSGSGKYLNLGVALKTGLAEGVDTRQVIGVVCESVDTLATGNHVFHLIFYHAQNDVPEYYSSRTYVSIPTAGMRNGDRIIISVNSYSGLVTKEFTVSRQ